MSFRLVFFAALAMTLGAAPHEEPGRPVILFVHGRGMIDRDTAETRKLWLNSLRSTAKQITRDALVNDDDVRLVWYADVLDPRSSEACDYDSSDLRARRDAKRDPNLKGVVSLVGGFLGAMTTMVSDNESATQLRALAGDASFLGDSRKRCASERRLADALDRAKRERRPVILVAHSLGAIVAYDYLSSRPDTGVVQQLVSVGSMLGAADLRRLLIGGDSTDTFASPSSVKRWINVRNAGDVLATPLSFGRDIVTTPLGDEPDQHEMVSYLRGEAGVSAILAGWCAAFTGKAPGACARTLER